MRFFVRLTFALAGLCAGQARATGYHGPMVYLDSGGRNVTASPEFFWELEVKRLARDYHPPEKIVAPDFSQLPPNEEAQPNEEAKALRNRFTAEADARDFAAALQTGRIKPPDPAEGTRQHQAARAVIERADPKTTDLLPAEFPSEFADYDRGALAYRRGPEHWEEARQAWEDLLKRPEQERHYRSLWAAFMLGKTALKRNDPAAVGWFERTRELAHAGFADSLGMAADSYGWEGRSEWKQDHAEKAAPLFLTQLALGDESAMVSLKALIPDREPIDGMLNYGPEPDAKSAWSAEQIRAADDKALAQLKRAAQDPLLRRLITAHILATTSLPEEFRFDDNKTALMRCARWLTIIKELKLTQLDDAEYIGWAAYNNGDYVAAARWLDLARKDSPAALWLRMKLQRRAGKLADATNSMAQAWQALRDTKTYTGWSGRTKETERDYLSESPHWSLTQSASGDLGALHLEGSDFAPALDTLLAGNLWNDAAFVAERVLTADELKAYVDQHPVTAATGPDNLMAKLRYLLGRRLVREDLYDQASAYLPPPYNQVLSRYVTALKEGRDLARPKPDRARALFTAAWLARYDGMEIMGTEGAPDGFAEGGEFEVPDLAQQLQSGFYRTIKYSAAGEEVTTNTPIVFRVPPPERQRLTKTKTAPDLRFHYRIIAGALAIQAATLLPNDTEELADVINHAGLWVKNADEKLGNRYYQLLEQRCATTAIGRAAIARHWFVDQDGPWSQEQQQAHDALRKELNIPSEN